MKSDRITGFIEVLIPISVCNLKCEYCYIIQRNKRSMTIPQLKHTPKEIGYALRPERFDGILYISLCGAGETMMTPDIVKIVNELVSYGHLVNITTNGTITKAFDELLKIVPPEKYKNINISFSYHYLELKRTNLSEIFWKNVNKVKLSGISFVIQLNLYDGYQHHLEDIKKECIENAGAYPQVAATRKEVDLEHKHSLMTDKTLEEYINMGNQFKSPLFDFTIKNFMTKQTEFCYAGRWSFVLNLASGIIKPCYQSIYHINIFKEPDKPIKFHPVGKHCQAPFCMNASHFLSLGVIPDQKNPSYAELRNRTTTGNEEWYNPYFKQLLSQKFNNGNHLHLDNNDRISIFLKGWTNQIIWNIMNLFPKKIISKLKNKYK